MSFDEHTYKTKQSVTGYLGPKASVFTLAWLASHRRRLKTLIWGGRRLTLMIIWDTKGGQYVNRSEADEEAIRQLTYGNNPVEPDIYDLT